MPAVASILHIGVPPRPLSEAYLIALARPSLAGDWLVQAPGIGLKLSYTYNPDGTWEHRLLSISPIELSVPPGGGIASVANVTLQIAETGAGQSLVQLWESTGTVNGIVVTLDYLGEGETTPLRLFTGTIDQVSVHDAVSEVLIVDSSIQKNILLPQTLLDQRTFPLAAPAIWGHRAPLVYGHGSHGGRLPLHLINLRTKTYLVAGHPLVASGSVAVFTPETSTYLGLASSSQVVRTAVGSAAAIALPQPPQELRFNLQHLPRQVVAQQAVVGASYAIDNVISSLCAITTTGLDSNLDGIGQLVIGTVASEDQRGNNTVVIDFAQHRRALASDPTVTGQLFVRTVDPATGEILRDNLLQTQQYRHSLNPQTASFVLPSLNLGANEQIAARVVARNEGGPGALNEYYEVGEIQIESYFQPQGDVALYLAGSAWEGRRDPDGRVTGYYGVPGAGTLLTQPDQILASLLIQELGLTVDPGWFALAYSTYAALRWTFDGGLGAGWAQETLNARQALGDLAQQGAGILTPTYTGQWGLRVYRTDVDAVMAFDLSTILCAEGTTAIQSGESRRSSFVMTLGNLETVANRFEVRYAYNPGTHAYDKVAIADRSGTTLNTSSVPAEARIDPQPLFLACLASYTNYGLLEPRTIDASWIQDATTAARLLQHLTMYFAAQRLTITFDTTFRALQLQVGDFITVTYPLLPTGENGQRFEVHALRYTPQQGRVTITASRAMTLRFSYLGLLQVSTGTIWYLWVNQAGELTQGPAVPSIAPFAATPLYPGEAPHWFVFLDGYGVSWYMTLNTLGECTTSTTRPTTGSGRALLGGYTLLGVDQHTYTFTIDVLGETSIVQQPPLTG